MGILKTHSLTLNETRFNLSSSCAFWIAGGLVLNLLTLLCDYSPYSFSKMKMRFRLYPQSLSASELLEYESNSQFLDIFSQERRVLVIGGTGVNVTELVMKVLRIVQEFVKVKN